MPLTTVKDYISGSASLFTNELARDKTLAPPAVSRERERGLAATCETFGPASLDIDDSVDHAGLTGILTTQR